MVMMRSRASRSMRRATVVLGTRKARAISVAGYIDQTAFKREQTWNELLMGRLR
jgi:hypothetical protein